MANLSHIFGGAFVPPSVDKSHIAPPDIQLREAIVNAGLTPPDQIYLDGKIHRFRSGQKGGRPAGDKTGWYIAFDDGTPAGTFGCWRSGITHDWRAVVNRTLTASEEMSIIRRMTEARALRDAERARQHETVAETVETIWAGCMAASPEHPYLKRKNISPNGARVTGDGRLVVPLFSPDGVLSSLQYIDSEGGKLYHMGGATGGCFWQIGTTDELGTIYMAEGFATAATIHQFTSRPVVVAYSASNLVPVLGALRDQHGKTQDIIIVADFDQSGVGQKYAEQACAKYGARFVMPPQLGDANDYVQAGGNLALLLEPSPTDNVHPFAQFIHYDLVNLKPREYILDGIIGMGLTLIAGAAAAGKTTQLVPLACKIAHLCDPDDPLRPLLRRKIIYITEDSAQVINILRSMRESGHLGGASQEEMHEYFKIVDAKRLPVAEIVKVAETYLAMLTENVSPVTGEVHRAVPWPIFDTSSSTIDLENESDNSLVGRALAVLKQRFQGMPMGIVGHIAKSLKRADVADFSARGAGAWEADANQVIYLIKEDDGTRWMEIKEAKHRFVARVDGIKFEAVINNIKTVDMLGNPVDETLIHGYPIAIETGGKKALKEQKAQDKKMGEAAAKELEKSKYQNLIIDELNNLDETEYRTMNELVDLLPMGKGNALEFIKGMARQKLIIMTDPPYPDGIIKRANSHRTIFIK